MSIQFASIADLANSLRAAATAHHEFEKGLGHADANWQEWYASFIALQQTATNNFVSCHNEVTGKGLVACIEHLKSHEDTNQNDGYNEDFSTEIVAEKNPKINRWFPHLQPSSPNPFVQPSNGDKS